MTSGLSLRTRQLSSNTSVPSQYLSAVLLGFSKNRLALFLLLAGERSAPSWDGYYGARGSAGSKRKLQNPR